MSLLSEKFRRASRKLDKYSSLNYNRSLSRAARTRVLSWWEMRRKRARKGADCGANKNVSYCVWDARGDRTSGSE